MTNDLKTVGGASYSIGKLNARQQFHLMRKVAPVLVRLDRLPALMGVATEANMETADKAALYFAALTPAIEQLAALPQQDVDQILDLALSVVSRDQGGGKLAPVLAGPGGMLMFADITLPHMLELVMLVLRENLGNFFDLLPTASS